MRLLIATLVACLLVAPIPVAAEQGSLPERPRLIVSAKVIANAINIEQRVSQAGSDSVKNGAIIGAVVGAVILGGLTHYVCQNHVPFRESPCWKGLAVSMAIGAGAGALGGAGIDKRFHLQPHAIKSVGPP